MEKSFDHNKFIRDNVSITIEEKNCDVCDLTQAEKDHIDDVIGVGQPTFQEIYLDPYIMRRFVVDVSGHQDCDTISVLNSVLNDYLDLDGQNPPPDFLIAGGTGGTVPSGKYLLTKFDVRDRGDYFSVVSVSYVQYGDWTKIKIKS